MDPVCCSVTVRADPDRAFAVFAERIGDWWPMATHSLTRTGGVAFADGRLVETGPDGIEHEWGRVVAWEPPARLVFTWHLGRDAATEVEVTFTAVEGGTEVALEHRGWEAWGDEAAERHGSYSEGWPAVLARYAEAT